MSFRFDILRNVLKERDAFIYSVYKILENDNTGKYRNKSKKSIHKISQMAHMSLLNKVSDLLFEFDYYSLTTEFAMIYSEIFNKKKSLIKKDIKSIYDDNTKKSKEFWYYNIINNGIHTKIDRKQTQHKLCAYLYINGRKVDIFC